MNIIEAGDLLDFVSRGDVVVIDARGGMGALERFDKGHFDGAFFVDLDSDLSAKPEDPAYGGRHPLPKIEDFAKLVGSFGIGPDTVVVVYDDKRGAMAAARFWWMMKSIGHKETYVVSGGLEDMIREGIELSTDTYELLSDTSDYPVEAWGYSLATISEVEMAALDSNRLVIDVREPFRYFGESEPIDLVAGHIPGAVNIPFSANLDESGKFLSAELLKDKYNAQLGSVPVQQVIVHCGSGVTACHTLLALEEAGLPGASLYVGSWSEWSRRNKPIETSGA